MQLKQKLQQTLSLDPTEQRQQISGLLKVEENDEQNGKDKQNPNNSSLEDNKQEDLFEGLQMLCQCGKPLMFYCSSSDCESDASICQPFQGKCFQKHSSCTKSFFAQNLHKYLNSQVIRHEDIREIHLKQIQKYIDKIIDEASEIRNSLEQKLKSFGLNQHQQSITKSIQRAYKKNKDSQTQISGDNIMIGWEFGDYDKSSMNDFYQKHGYQNWYLESLNRFKEVVQNTKNKINWYFQDINEYLKYIHIKYTQNYDFKQYFKQNNILKQVIQGQTKILPQQLGYLVSILNQHLTFNSVRKLFSYEKNNSLEPYNNKRLLENLEGEHNILFLVRNVNNKTYGFFTASKFSTKNHQGINEENKGSFIFSLDLNISQKLTNQKYSLNYSEKDNKIEIGQLTSNELSEQNHLNDKNGACILLNGNAMNYQPCAQIFLKKTQSKPLNYNPQNTIQIDYNQIHGQQRVINLMGVIVPQIIMLQIYTLNII